MVGRKIQTLKLSYEVNRMSQWVKAKFNNQGPPDGKREQTPTNYPLIYTVHTVGYTYAHMQIKMYFLN